MATLASAYGGRSEVESPILEEKGQKGYFLMLIGAGSSQSQPNSFK